MGCNRNVMGYLFPEGTRVVSSPSSLSCLFLHLLKLVFTLTSFQIQPIVAKHKDLVWLARNLKLEVTKYSRQIYGLGGYVHPRDDVLGLVPLNPIV